MIQERGIGYRTKKEPYQLTNFKGKSQDFGRGKFNIETVPLLTKYFAKPEWIVFDVTEIANHDTILGKPWLCRINPDLDWTNNRVHERVESRQIPRRDLAPEQRTQRRPYNCIEPISKSKIQGMILIIKKVSPSTKAPVEEILDEYKQYEKLF